VNYESVFSSDLGKRLTKAERSRFVHNLAEYRARKSEALKLYEPMVMQQAFHQSQTYIRLFIAGNQYGKSLGASVEFARMVQGADPFDKYPKTNGRIYVVGKSLKHCADTIYPLLFKPGAFKIIRDEITDDWRTFRPWDVADKAREKDAIPAPPLIPERMIASVGWKSKAKQEIDVIRFVTGWEAVFFSAEGQHPQGGKVDYVWFDEEIQPSKKDGPWFPEMSARLITRKGRLVWTAAPQKGYEELYELYQKGEKQHAEYRMDPVKYPRPTIDVFKAKQEDNVFIGAEEKARFAMNLSAEDALVRTAGEFNFSSRLVYPEFALSVHGYPLEGDVPASWSRYMYVDPGHTICAGLFIACPPPDECPAGEPMALAYDEFYIPQANAPLFAQAAKLRQESQQFEDFVIDMHGARPHEAGSGLSVYEQYEEELRRLQCFSRNSGYGFTAGNDDIAAGVTRGHSWLAWRRKEGTKTFDVPPRFRVKTNKDKTVSAVPNFVYEMNRYPKQKVAGRVLDKPNDRGPTHLCQCFRYCVMHGPEFVAVKMKVNFLQRMQRVFDQLTDRGGGPSSHLSFGRSA
jgi:hypothetical protein